MFKSLTHIVPGILGFTCALLPMYAFASSSAAGVPVLEPLCASMPTITVVGGPYEILMRYFSCISGFLYDIAVGACVLWVLVGGVKIIISGGDGDMFSQGKNAIFSSITALVILLFSPVLLKFLNGSAYS